MTIITQLRRKKEIAKFAKRVGLLSFGSVDQHSDEHRIVRGLTVSDTHKDSSYATGSVGGYDIIVVDRNDKIRMPDGKTDKYSWLILSIQLHTKYPIPHFLILANNHDTRSFSALFTSFPNMKATELGVFEEYTEEFTTRFTLFARPAKSIELQKFITADVARKLAVHFWPLAIEQHDNVLYVYAVKQPVMVGLLETMLENGIWLAGQLDARHENVISD